MDFRKVCEITPWGCPPGGPGSCLGCEHFLGIDIDPQDHEWIEVKCDLEEEDTLEEEE